MRIALAALSVVIATPAAHAETLTGPAYVVDGDTVEIAGKRIRLYGIDAPESAQTCCLGNVKRRRR